MSSFAALNNARRALAAQLKGMEVAGQNIANANTAGYSRQVVNYETVTLDSGVVVRPGDDALALAGVEVAEIRRQYDSFLDARLRELTSNNSETVARYDVLTRFEELLHEPGDATIGTAMEDLWTSFAQLVTNPRNEASRNNVLYRASTVTETFRDVAKEASALRAEAGERAMQSIERINAIVQSLAGVNDRLVASSATDSTLATPNALFDKRDALLRELAQYANVEATELEHGTIRVTLGGRTLLENTSFREAVLVNDNGSMALKIAGTEVPNEAAGGSLGGELLVYNQDLPRYAQLLDQLAMAVMDQVNTIHASGFDMAGQAGEALFTGTGAYDFDLATAVKNHPEKLAVSLANDGTDGRNAQRLADLRESPASGSYSVSFQYASLVSRLGSDAAALKVTRDNHQALVEYAEARAEAVSGVSLDEELADMVRYQQAYSAAARVLTSIDEALDVLINRTGQVGR